MVHAILDTKFLFTKIIATSVYHSNSEIANLRHALAVAQQLLDRYPTSSMLHCDLQQVKIILKGKNEERLMFFY